MSVLCPALRLLGEQRVHFLMVGGMNTAVGYMVYAGLSTWVFAEISFGYLVSLIISFAAAIPLAFILHRRIVFFAVGNVALDFARFVSVYMFAILLNIGILPMLVELLNLHHLLAQAVVLVVTTALSFFGHKNVSFRRKSVPGNCEPVSDNTPERCA